MKYYLHTFFLLYYFNCNSQGNLIYNGDFEIYDTCPTSISTPGDYQITRCTGWYNPTLATPDYFNTCASWPVSVPNNIMGTRTPYSGNGYCGLLIEYCYHPNGTCTYGWWIEYIQSELIEPLKTGYEYEFSSYISLTNKLFAQYAYAKFGVLFSNNSTSRLDGKPFTETPQIINNIPNYLTDTNWVEFKKKFIAQGNEKFITLGFFIDTLNIDTLIRPENIDPVASWFFSSYYYIDNCSLIPTGNIYYHPNIFTPNGDGVNDYWTPFVMENDEKINIYNRWGNQIFELTYENKKWYGKTISGEDCADGVYYFTSNKNKKGTIQLIK